MKPSCKSILLSCNQFFTKANTEPITTTGRLFSQPFLLVLSLLISPAASLQRGIYPNSKSPAKLFARLLSMLVFCTALVGVLPAQTIGLISNPDAASPYGGFVGSPIVYGSNLYFGYQNVSGKVQLAKYDGTSVTLVSNPDAGGSGFVGSPIVYGSNLYCQYSNFSGKVQLAKYDGTSVTLVSNPDAGNGFIGSPIVYGSNLYCPYKNSSYKNQLAKYDGTSITLVSNPGSADQGFISTPIVYGSNLYCQYSNLSAKYQLAKYDGTYVTLISNPESGPGFTGTPIVYGSNLYCAYSNASDIYQLGKYNGSAVTLVDNPDVGNGFTGYPIVYGSNLYGQYSNFSGKYQLAKYDGSSLTLVSNPNPGLGFNGSPIVYGSNLYFPYYNVSSNYQLEKYDGTSVTLISNPDAGGGFQGSPIVYGSNLYFKYANASGKNQLAKYDGTSVTLVNNPDGGGVGANPIVYGSNLYFQYYDKVSNSIFQLAKLISNNADLSALTTTAGTLTPTFAAATTAYTAGVTNAISTVTVTPTQADANATIQVRVNGGSYATVNSGAASSALLLNVGSNTIDVKVTAQDGTTIKTYSITVTRAAASSNADLSALTTTAGTISPSFAAATTAYTASVANATTTVTVTPTVAQANATIQVRVNGGSYATVASGAASSASLNVGSNTIDVQVTAQDGTTIKTYSITVTRAAPSSNANLSALTTTAGAISPAFAAATTAYTASVTNATTSITVTPTKSDANAIIQARVNSGSYATVTSGSASSPLSLNVGSNTINVLVTAQDGTTIKTYTITVTRAVSNNADLLALTLSAGNITPTFASGTVAYSVSVPNAISNINATPIVNQTNATVTVNGAAVTSGAASGAIALNVGSNTIDVLVTAQDGTTIKTYTITVTRACNTITAALSGTATICAGTSANLAVAISGGTSPYSIIYSGGTVNNYISGSNIPVSPASDTNYTLTSVSDAKGCVANEGWKVIKTGGTYFSVGIKADGSLWTWGFNASGQLGNGTYAINRTPGQIGTDRNWSTITAGGDHTVAIKTDGSLWSWGYNVYGQLGDNTSSYRNIPVQIGTDTNWSSVSAGDSHTIAIKTDGTLWAWGNNSVAQLGTGGNTNLYSPVQIGNATNWSTISAGGLHTLATKTDGSLWAWGYNASGQLGDGTNSQRYTPVQIGNANNWSAISAGGSHSIALKKDGSLWAWGANDQYQLGNGSQTNSSNPAQIGIATWASISAGYQYSLAIKSDGSIWAWGNNAYGQLGNLSLINLPFPNQISNVPNWSSISAGTYHSIGTLTEGSIATWGYNRYSELGNGSYNNYPKESYPGFINIPNTSINNIAIAVNNNNTISLSSAFGTDLQTVYVNNAITAITYNTTSATGASISGLPTGVTGNWSSNVFTISGTPSVSGTFYYLITLTGGCGTVTKTGSMIVRTSDATLSALTTAAGTISPTFAAATTAYTASVTNATTSVTVTPTKTDANATIQVRVNSGSYATVTSGAASSASLNVGSNTIDVKVTAQDGTTVKTYTITVTRAAASSNADLSSITTTAGTISPSFAAATTAYTAGVSNATSSVTVTPTLAQANATIQVRVNSGSYATVTSGAASSASLNVGSNTIDVQVTAQDGTTIKTYTITVTRTALLPTITSFTSASGAVGSLVTITGTNLSNPTSLSIGGVAAIAVSNTGTSLVAMVMPGATTGAVSITTIGGTATAGGNFTITANLAPNSQQGNKLVGTGNTGAAYQGSSLAISADGNTAIVGGPFDNINQGAAWVYTRTSGAWTQQGNKLVGTGNTGAAFQGISVAISADGNTAVVGGYGDNYSQGAAWVYTRTSGAWAQQGNKLVGTGNTGAAAQGISVAISADGNTTVVGGFIDNSDQGAAWVYTRSGGTWAQQGNKLVGTGNTGEARQGRSVAISADGNTAVIGGLNDNNAQGAAWVYTRSGGTWAQQGNKLVGTGYTGAARQGYSVAMSADGNTTVVGGYNDNSDQGAAWVFTRTSGAWAQQGNKLVGTGNTGAAQQGQSVSISADGNTAVVGGYTDNSYQGAVWVYTRSGGTWAQQGNKLVGTGNAGAAYQGQSVAISADGNSAIVGGWNDNSANGAAWAYTYVPSANADLSALTTTAGTISPSFAAATTAYTASVANATTSVTVTPTQSDANATIQVRVNSGSYATVASAAASSALLLNVGSNTIDVKVTAQDGTTIKTYTITVTRVSTNADLSSLTTTAGTISPTFAAATTSYTASVANATASLTVTPTKADANATIQVRVNSGSYATVASGAAASASLNVGSNTIDVKVTAQDGTTIKTYTITVTRAFSPGNALNFDGSNDYVDLVANITNLATANFTLEAWVKTTGTGQGIIECSNSNTVWEDGEKSFYIGLDGTPTFVGYNNEYIRSTQTVNDGNWHHVAVVWAYSGSGTAGTGKMYIDGLDKTSPSTNYAARSGNAGTFKIGSPNYYSGETPNFFNGSIDEVRIWNVARTATEIQANMSNELLGTETGLKAYYKLNEAIASGTNTGWTIAFDASPNNYNGTLTNLALTGATSNWVTGNVISATASTNADLSALTTTAGTISPSFVAGTTAYSVSVANATSSVTVTPTKSDANANIRVRVNGGSYTTMNSGTVSGALALSIGSNTIDVQVTAQDGTTIKTYTITVTRVYSPPGNALNFDGSNDYVDLVANITNLATANFTLEAWVKTTGTGQGIIQCSNSNTVLEDGEKSFYIGLDGTPTFVGYNNDWIYSTQIVNDGNWHHVAVVWAYSGSGTAGTGKMYIDGLDKTSPSTNYAARSANSGTFKIGSPDYYSGTAPNFFNGSIDEVRIWNVARTATEIQANMSNELLGTETGLKAYYKLNEAIASGTNTGWTIAFDASPNNNHGTLTNLALTGATSNWVTGTVTTTTASTNADLSALTTTAGTISPSFVAGTTAYSVSVANATSSVTVTPTKSDANANIRVRVNGGSYTTMNSGIASGALALSIGSNTIDVQVTAQDGTTIKTYTITVTRVSTNADLSALTTTAGTISPSFAAATTAYTASVTNATTSVTVTPTQSDANATIQVRANSGSYATVTSGAASSALSLNVGSNTIDVKVTAQDGTTIKTYTITVTRNVNNLDYAGLSSTPATGAWSLRKLSSTYSSFAVKVRRVSDNAEANIAFDGSNTISGSSVATVTAAGSSALTVNSTLAFSSFFAGTDVRVMTWYDQSGNGNDITQTTTASMPKIVSSGVLTLLNAKAALSFSGTNMTIPISSSVLNVQGSIATVHSQPAQQGGYSAILSWRNGVSVGYGPLATTGQFGLYNTNNINNSVITPGLVAVNTMYASNATWTGSNASVTESRNKSVTSGALSTRFTGVGTGTLGNDGVAFTGSVPEVLIFATPLTTTDRQSLENNQFAYYASTDATLSALTTTAGTIAPTFAAATTAYTASVSNATTSVTVTPTTNDATATVTVNGTAVTSGSASGAIALNVGTNTITVLVTAQDGTTTKSYTITVTRAAITWTGNSSTDWNTAGNWSTNAVPTATDNVTIANVTNAPVITATQAINNVAINSSASLTVTGTLQIAGAVSNSGTFTATAGTVVFNGTSAQTIPANVFSGNTLQNLTINNSAGVTLGGTLNVTGTVTPTAGTLTTNGNLVLKSSAAATASIGAGTGSYISGNVTVERYIPSMARKNYTAVSAAVTSPSIYNSWQEAGAATVGYGTQITGGIGTTSANGFDGNSASGFASVFTYNDLNAAGSKWVQLTNTNATALAAGRGYFMYVRGDRTVAAGSTATNNTILRATGTLATGNTSPTLVTTTAGKFNLIANPYASTIDWRSTGITKTNMSDAFWVFDPNLGSGGSFVTYSNGIVSPSDARVTKYIQSGQAFIVQNAASGTPSITFTEASKAPSFSQAAANTVFGNEIPAARLNINVYKADSVLADGVVAVFGKDYKAGFGKEDAAKMDNFSETFALRRNDSALSIEGRPLVTGKDTLFFNMKNFDKKAYTLKIDGSSFAGTTAMLADSYTGSKTALDINGTTAYQFTVNNEEASASNGRFMILFGSTAVLPATDAAQANDFFVKATPNPVKNRLQVSFKTATTANTVITIINSLGQTVRKVPAGKTNSGNVTIEAADLAAGVYTVQLVSGDTIIAVQQVVKE